MEIVLDVRAFRDGEAHLAEDGDDLVDGLAQRVDAPLGLGTHRERHVDALPRELLAQRLVLEPARGVADRRLDIVLEQIERGAALAPRLGIEAGQPLQQRRDAAPLAEDGDADLLQRVAARRRLDQVEDLIADVIEAFHAVQRSSEREKGAEHRVGPSISAAGRVIRPEDARLPAGPSDRSRC